MSTQADAYPIYAEFAGYNSTRMNLDGLHSDPSLNKAYYDGIFCSYAMRDFFATASPYEGYADEYFASYADYYLRNPGVNYGVPGYWAFGKGLAEHYLRRGVTQAKTDLAGLCASAAYHGVGLTGYYTIEGNFPGTHTVDGHALSREWSYCVMNYIQLARCQALTAAQEARRDFCFEDLFRIVDWWFTSATASYVRPFMVGILMRALIEYYEHVDADSRIPTAITTCLTELIDPNLYIAANKTFYYTDRDGTGQPWGSPDLDRDPDGTPDLNMLIAPAFAWLYSITGTASWATYAQDLFDGSVPVYSGGFWQSGAYLGTQSSSNPNGKQLNQQLLWHQKLWDYLEGYAPPATATTRSSLVTCLGCGGGPVPEPVAAFDATDYGTVIADYDFGSAASVLNGSAVAASNNETVATVNAIAGTGALTQSTDSKRPVLKTNVLNGYQVIELDGTDDWFTAPTDWVKNRGFVVVAAVFKMTDAGGHALVQTNAAGTVNLLTWVNNTNFSMVAEGKRSGGAGFQRFGSNASQDTWFGAAWTYDFAGNSCQIDSVNGNMLAAGAQDGAGATANSDANGSETNTVGAGNIYGSNAFKGQIARLIFYSAQTTQQRTDMLAALEAYYGALA